MVVFSRLYPMGQVKEGCTTKLIFSLSLHHVFAAAFLADFPHHRAPFVPTTDPLRACSRPAAPTVTPKFLTVPRSPLEAVVGRSVLLDCQVYGRPEPSVQWDRGSRLIGLDDPRSVPRTAPDDPRSVPVSPSTTPGQSQSVPRRPQVSASQLRGATGP